MHMGDLFVWAPVPEPAVGKVLEWSSDTKVVGSILRPLRTTCGSVYYCMLCNVKHSELSNKTRKHQVAAELMAKCE